MHTRQRSLTHNQTVFDTQPDEKILSILSYVKGTTDRIGRILNKHNIQTIFKPPKKIGQILRNPKDQRPPLSSAGVYKISCSCGQVHSRNRENGHPTDKRTHQCDVRLKHITQSGHNIEIGHQILFDKTATKANITSYFPSIESQRAKNTLTI